MKKNTRKIIPSSSINSSLSLSPPKDNNEEFFTEKEIFDWLAFANEISNLTGMPLNPQLVNTAMKNITLNTLGKITEERVNKALENPKENELELLSISETFSTLSMPYRRIIDYMSNLLSFSFTTSCMNAKFSDYSSKAYQKDLDVVKEFFYKFDVVSEFQKVVKRMFLEEMFFGVLRDEGEKWTLQQLPSTRCIVTGRAAEANLLFSFDYSYFLNSGTDILMYPPIFRKTYAEKILINTGKNAYVPSLPLDERMNSTWIWWADCSPVDNFWAWKMSPEVAARVPFFSPMFPDLAMQPLVRGLQKSSLMASSVKFILGQVPMLEQKAKLSDSFAMDGTSLARFLKLLQGAINNEAVRVAAAPLNDMKQVGFDADHSIYSDYIKTTLGTSGVNSNLLFSADIKPNVEETRLSVNVDEMISFGLYNYFNRFVEYYINRKTSKFKFQVHFEGSNFYSDKERRWQVQKDNIGFGIVNVQKIAASQGVSPFVFQAQLEESRAMNFVDNLTPITPAAQLSGGGNIGGRPSKPDSQISDSGSQTQENGGNLSKVK